MKEFEGSLGRRSTFLVSTYTMVSVPSTNSLVSWSHHGRSFVVWDSIIFSENLLPRYFKHKNFSHFIRQLHIYGFRKIDKKRWEFANDNFVRGQPNLMKNIHRKKSVFNRSLQNVQASENAVPFTESERESLKDRIKTLHNDNELALLQLRGQKSDLERYELQMQDLSDMLKHLNVEHQNIVSALAKPLKEPPSALHLTPQIDTNVRKRRFPRDDFSYYEIITKDNQNGNSQALNLENGCGALASLSNAQVIDQLESSLALWENIVQDVSKESRSLATSTRGLNESTSRSKCPANTSVIDVDAYPEVHNTNANTSQVTSTRKLYEPTGCSKYSLDSFVIDVDAYPEFFDIDPNTDQCIAASTSEPVKQGVGISTPFPTGYNDPFWQQFLTEYPGSSEPADGAGCQGGQCDG